MAEAGVPAGPVTFTDDPFDTFYSSFESQGKIPPAMLVTTSKPSLQRSQQLFADAHIWARQLRLTSRRLQKRDFKITELNPDEQALCRKLFHSAVHNFDPVEYEQPRLALQFDFTKPCLAMRESTSKTALERLDSVPHCFKDNLHAFHTHTHTKDLMMSKGIRSLLAAMTVIAGTAN